MLIPKGTNFGVGGSYLAALQMGDAKIECEWMSIETMVCDIPLQPGTRQFENGIKLMSTTRRFYPLFCLDW